MIETRRMKNVIIFIQTTLTFVNIFSYASLNWMFTGKFATNKILKNHYRTFQVLYSEYHKSYEEFLEIITDISIHQKHLCILALEVYKSIMHFNPEFMWHCFNENVIPYKLRRRNRLLIPFESPKSASLYFCFFIRW